MMELTEEQELYSIQAILCLAGVNFPALVTRLEPHLSTTKGRKDLGVFLQLLILAALFQTKKNMVCSVYRSREEDLVLTANTGFSEPQMAETSELFKLLRSGALESAQAMLRLRARNRQERKISKYRGVLESSESKPGAKWNAEKKLGELPDLREEKLNQQSAKVKEALRHFPLVSKIEIDLSDIKGWLLSAACVGMLYDIRNKTLRIVSDPAVVKEFKFTSEMLDALLKKENLTLDCLDAEMQRSIQEYFSCGTPRRIVNHSEQQALCPSNSARVEVCPRSRRGRGELVAGSHRRQPPSSQAGSSQSEPQQPMSSPAGSSQAGHQQPMSSRAGSSQAGPHIVKQLACTMLCCVSCFMVVSKLECFTTGTHGQIYPPVPVQEAGLFPVVRGALRDRLTGKKRQRSSDELPATESHNAMFQFVRGLPPCPNGDSSAGASSSGSRQAPPPRRGSARKN